MTQQHERLISKRLNLSMLVQLCTIVSCFVTVTVLGLNGYKNIIKEITADRIERQQLKNDVEVNRQNIERLATRTEQNTFDIGQIQAITQPEKFHFSKR